MACNRNLRKPRTQAIMGTNVPVQPGKPHGIPLPTCGALLGQLLPQLQEAPPERLLPQQGWPE